MNTLPSSDITVRRMDFAIPPTLDPVFVRGCPEESFVYLGLSLVLPHLEPYLIRTMQAALRQIEDPLLAARVKQFCAQEGQHHRQHTALNQALGLLDIPALASLDAEIAADYRRFSEEESLQFNAAYAEGFEAATAALGVMAFKSALFDQMEPLSADLWRWHTVEELEHRTVAFDVYERLFGDRRYRLKTALFAHKHLTGFAVRAAKALLAAHPQRLAGAHPWRRWAFAVRLGRHFLPRLLDSYLPGYDPRAIPLPDGFSAQARRYTQLAVRTS
ncbi:MAG: metal-dependent hydrolase [Alphaproteobacteria bacterium]|nr:metal-dependent hydrolase [Alphaproteobacteria bacterium]